MKVACHVLTRPGHTKNVLPDLLKRWFGDDAGSQGTEHVIELFSDGEYPRMRPRTSNSTW